jgi:hypothetical protein
MRAVACLLCLLRRAEAHLVLRLGQPTTVRTMIHIAVAVANNRADGVGGRCLRGDLRWRSARGRNLKFFIRAQTHDNIAVQISAVDAHAPK